MNALLRHRAHAAGGQELRQLPALPGQGSPLRIFDTSAAGVRTSEPGPTARLYVCGITPYDATHLGHAATYNAFDLIQRVWRDAGVDTVRLYPAGETLASRIETLGRAVDLVRAL